MIRGLAGLKLAHLFTSVQKPFKPARGLQPLPGMDTLHLSRQGRNLAGTPGGNLTANIRPSVAVQAYQSVQSVSPDSPTAPAEPSMADRMRASMFATKGDDRFDARLDLNGNGRIDFADMKRFLEGADAPAIRPAEPAPSRADRLRNAFFTNKRDDRFDPSADLNGDGRVNFADVALLRNGGATQTRPAEPADTATRMRDAFFATKGEADFDPALDINDDGRINFADLQALRKPDSDGDAARPVRPAEPVTDDESPFSSAAPIGVVDQAPIADNERLADRVRDSFFADKRDGGFDSRADVNADGRVDFRDIAALRAKD